MIEIRTGTRENVRELYEKLPLEQFEHIDGDHLAALEATIMASRHVWVGEVDGEIAAAWGIYTISLLSRAGYLWMLTTPLASRNTFAFVRRSQIFMNEVKTHYRTLEGRVSAHNRRSIAWLRWLGFTVDPGSSPCRFYLTVE